MSVDLVRGKVSCGKKSASYISASLLLWNLTQSGVGHRLNVVVLMCCSSQIGGYNRVTDIIQFFINYLDTAYMMVK